MDHPKKRRRRRRRRTDKVPVSATLIVANEIKGSIALLSSNLYDDLFASQSQSEDEKALGSVIQHVAVTPWSPTGFFQYDEDEWTILPVRRGPVPRDEGTSILSISPKSTALAAFSEALKLESTPKNNLTNSRIRILDVQPLQLDVVIVSVDGEALDRHEEVQAKFGGGFLFTHTNGSASKGKGKAKSSPNGSLYNAQDQPSKNQETQLTAAVREALASSTIIYQGESLPLPLPAHPITHVSLPPARITLCEPVSQGIVVPSTRIVINREKYTGSVDKPPPSTSAQNGIQESVAEENDDFSNEQYYSAAEEDKKEKSTLSDSEPSTPDEESPDQGDSDSDSSDNIISMSTPALATRPSGAHSTLTASTPQLIDRRADGINTPRSVFSNYTATTARNGTARKGRPFTLKPLMSPIPDDLLHPRPAIDEDEEARVFVDVKLLLKLGCFSGDWVKLEVHQSGREDHWGMDALAEDSVEVEGFRVVKYMACRCQRKQNTPSTPRAKLPADGQASTILFSLIVSDQKPGCHLFCLRILVVPSQFSWLRCSLCHTMANTPSRNRIHHALWPQHPHQLRRN